ncbi:Trafficking protein particle complex subunit 31 [Elasticomyces elasticus]|nr:Trafficking protein particle complex subunit 31 [Elasticomyces elasticus]
MSTSHAPPPAPAPVSAAPISAADPNKPSIIPFGTTAKPHAPLRYPSTRRSIYDRNLNRTQRSQLSLSSLAHIFNALIQHAHARSPSVADFESRLSKAGYPLGVKLLELHLYRGTAPAGGATGAGAAGAAGTRPVRILALLQFIHTTLWRALFGRSADALEISSTKANEYMITDNEPVLNSFISVPREMSQLNCAAYLAGIIEGVCDAAGFATEGVSAHWAEGDELWPGKTIFLVRFREAVVEREEMLKAGPG